MVAEKVYHLSPNEVKTFLSHVSEHLKFCREQQDKYGVLLNVEVSETGIGAATHLKCRCGWNMDITDYSIW